jgi:hypothetical protein
MSLEYYLFYKKHYEDVINNLDNIINSTLDTNDSNLLVPYNKIFLIEKKQHIIEKKTICDNKIHELCNHEFEDDMIDITPERSQYITYCILCGYTK